MQSCDAMESEAKQKAQEEAAAIVAKAKVAIEAEKQSAISELKGSVVDLSVDIATRVIGEDFSDEDLEALVARIEEAYEDLEIDPHRGEQALYPVVFSLE